MACEVCEHCNSAVRKEESIVRNGCSYHTRCHKCYVCSETNLQNANVFKGVIFCYGCSNRIFQGCSTARKAKTRKSKIQSHRERIRRRNNKQYKQRNENRVLELARLTSVMDSPSEKSADLKSSTPQSTIATANTNRTYEMKETQNLKKHSIEMGTTTTVTQELLKHIHSPIDIEIKAAPAKPRKKRKSRMDKHKKDYCSDLRIAELGTSTEIAHMALRRPSEIPVMVQSETGLKFKRSQTLPNLTPDSEISGDDNMVRTYTDSEYSSRDLMTSNHWLDRRIGSILKLPYKSFKRNILNRSSLVSVVMNSKRSECMLRRFKTLFQHEITEHQRRGLKRLFSTINSKKTPYKLGWLDIMTKIPEDERCTEAAERKKQRCRHFRYSHSYRCMRTQVMRLAGPTRSELAVIRTKLKKVLCLNVFKGLRNFNKQFVDILTSEACGQNKLVPVRSTSLKQYGALKQ